MRLIIILGCVWFASAGTVPDKCDGVLFNGQKYEKEVLKSGLAMPDYLTYDKSTDTIFFSYTVRPENVVGTEFLTTAYFNLNTKEFQDIHVPGGGASVTIDPKNNVVYFGSSKGIYKYNRDTKKTEFLTAKDTEVLFVIYDDDDLFYIADHNHQLYCYTGTETKQISDKNINDINSLIEDSVDDEAYFLLKNSFSELYRGVGENGTLDQYTPPETDFLFRGFAKDGNKNVFVFGGNGVYTPNRAEKTLEKVADIKNVFSVAFDKDNNIIYSDFEDIYKLTRNDAKCTPLGVL